MRDGMVVVDGEGRIVDVNASARRALGRRREALLARPLGDVLPLGDPGPDGGGAGETSLDLDGEGGLRRYLVETTPLDDRRGRPLGSLVLLHDVTEQERAQARLLEQERVVATLQERERLARELHDSVGQVLGYLSMQAQTASKRLRDGDAGKAEELLSRLASVAQHAHADVRESILALRAASSADWAFLPTLRHYLEDFEAQYGVTTVLTVDGVTDDTVPPPAGVQLLRVIQEAMANARRHGPATAISIELERGEDDVRITVVDDGGGFDPATLGADGDGHFGLGFMRERMAQIAGDVTIDSSPGAGTRVCLTAPLDRGREGRGMRVLLADDHTLLVEGLRNLLEAHDIEVVGAAGNGQEAAELARELLPDVILMDIRMPVCDGLCATRLIKAELPQIKIIVLTTSADEQDLFEAVKSGRRRLPAQEHGRREPHRGAARCPAGRAALRPRAGGQAARRVRAEAPRAAAPSLPPIRPRRAPARRARRRSRRSRSARDSPRCWRWSPRASRTRRSASACTSARAPSSTTWGRSCGSSTCRTARRCWPTRAAWRPTKGPRRSSRARRRSPPGRAAEQREAPARSPGQGPLSTARFRRRSDRH